MRRPTRRVRGIVASLFVMSLAATGVVVTMSPAGAGGNGHGDKNCKIPKTFVPRETTAETEVQPPEFWPAHCETLEVTKVVTGTPHAAPPPGTQFSVVVECLPLEDNNDIRTEAQSPDWMDWVDSLPEGNKPPFKTTLTFGPEGGTQNVLVAAKHASECTVTEKAPPGCTLKSIDPPTTKIGEHADTDAATVRKPVVHPVTVTNQCDPPPQPSAATAAGCGRPGPALHGIAERVPRG